jgi:hypothetical protein
MGHQARAKDLLFGRLSVFVLALMLTFLPSALAQRNLTLTVSRSNVLAEVSKRARQSPSLSPVELAAYGNDLIAKKGFDYEFDLCDILNQRDRKQNSKAQVVRTYPLSSESGGKLTFRFTIANSNESLCGECWSSIPILDVTGKKMVLLAGGNRYRVKRPAPFVLDEVHLVDATLKKVLRTWQLPYQAVPVGVSADGAKLYVDFYKGNSLDDLVLEVSENGPPQFRERAVIKSSEGKTIDNHPKDPSNAYLSFITFRVGEKTYHLKFTAPCT